jgi:hypothetical protein
MIDGEETALLAPVGTPVDLAALHAACQGSAEDVKFQLSDLRERLEMLPDLIRGDHLKFGEYARVLAVTKTIMRSDLVDHENVARHAALSSVSDSERSSNTKQGRGG